ncbi:hypothetical protein TW95_gp1354 [Pandoravirus inopinatum]|uniref:Uncharacterized protein n=1 Tax=Pandoravirus inopinatum TaxID=1605721 RepID=A0A0B5IYY2_9VIRU|nr:hypothetical protein TW95_gp1354 [Pandoravirus inopinatum]AJF98088.1 hypothetical protein [Pandoravirus inopinatum]
MDTHAAVSFFFSILFFPFFFKKRKKHRVFGGLSIVCKMRQRRPEKKAWAPFIFKKKKGAHRGATGSACSSQLLDLDLDHTGQQIRPLGVDTDDVPCARRVRLSARKERRHCRDQGHVLVEAMAGCRIVGLLAPQVVRVGFFLTNRLGPSTRDLGATCRVKGRHGYDGSTRR